MKIYTSYFAHLRKLPETIAPISIARYAPKGYTGLAYPKLAPDWDTLSYWKEHHDETVYKQMFNDRCLNKLDPHTVLQDLISLSDGKDLALTCYEKAGDFCHRILVAEWLIKNCGVTINEI